MSSMHEAFDRLALKEWAEPIGRRHWPRVAEVLSGLPESAGKYLEIGPGNGYALQYMAENKFKKGQCYAVELSPEMAFKSRLRTQHLRNVSIDIGEYIKWPPNGLMFDLIFSMGVFYFLKDLRGNIDYAASMLCEGGHLIVMVDVFAGHEGSQTWQDKLGLQLTRWSAEQYATAFKEAGLANVNYRKIIGGDLEPGRLLCVSGTKVP